MVYTGRPSPGCLSCRQRRIKCDEARPICSQCLKSKRACTGYRNKEDLLFHDENDTTIRRVKRAENAKKHRSLVLLSQGSSPSSENTTSGDDASSISINLTPSQPIEMAALNFWIYGMVFSPRAPDANNGHLKYLPQLYQQATSDSALAQATITAGLVAYSKFSGDQRYLSSRAYHAYGKAVSSLRTAMQSSRDMSKNETLMAVLIMIIVECLIASTVAPEEKWSSHVMGAILLIRSRGNGLFDDEVGLHLFLAVRTFLIQGCLTGCVPLDPLFGNPFPGWQARLGDEVNSTPYRLSQITMLVAPLRRRAIEALQNAIGGDEESTAVVLGLLKECETTDLMLLEWASTLSKDYEYRPQIIPSEEGHLEETGYASTKMLHLYDSAHVVQVWNGYRCARIFLNALILRCNRWLSSQEADEEVNQHELNRVKSNNLAGRPFSPLVYTAVEEDGVGSQRPALRRLNPDNKTHQNQESTCHSRLQKLADDVCSSIPVSLRPRISSSSLPPDLHSAIHAYFLVWPLYVTRGILSLPYFQRKWIRQVIVNITEQYQVRQAMTLVEIADRDPKRPLFAEYWDDWMTEEIWEHAYAYCCGAI